MVWPEMIYAWYPRSINQTKYNLIYFQGSSIGKIKTNTPKYKSLIRYLGNITNKLQEEVVNKIIYRAPFIQK